MRLNRNLNDPKMEREGLVNSDQLVSTSLTPIAKQVLDDLLESEARKLVRIALIKSPGNNVPMSKDLL